MRILPSPLLRPHDDADKGNPGPGVWKCMTLMMSENASFFSRNSPLALGVLHFSFQMMYILLVLQPVLGHDCILLCELFTVPSDFTHIPSSQRILYSHPLMVTAGKTASCNLLCSYDKNSPSKIISIRYAYLGCYLEQINK